MAGRPGPRPQTAAAAGALARYRDPEALRWLLANPHGVERRPHRQRVALLDPAALNVPVSVFVAVRTSQHSAKWLAQFREAVESIPEIVEAYRMSGEIDYLLRVVVPDIAGYDAVYKQLIEKIELADVTSSFSMEEMKHTTALPLQYA